MVNISTNYLQVVKKDTLENQVGLGICMAQFAFLYGMIATHPKHSLFKFRLPLGAKFLVISQLTIRISWVLRRHRMYHLRQIHRPGRVLTTEAATTVEATTTAARLAAQNWRSPTHISN